MAQHRAVCWALLLAALSVIKFFLLGSLLLGVSLTWGLSYLGSLLLGVSLTWVSLTWGLSFLGSLLLGVSLTWGLSFLGSLLLGVSLTADKTIELGFGDRFHDSDICFVPVRDFPFLFAICCECSVVHDVSAVLYMT